MMGTQRMAAAETTATPNNYDAKIQQFAEFTKQSGLKDVDIIQALELADISFETMTPSNPITKAGLELDKLSDDAAKVGEEADTKENRFKKFLAKGKFNDLDDTITAPNWRYNINGVDCIPQGEIVAVSGKPGAGKSTTLAILVGVGIGGGCFCGIRQLEPIHKTLWIDTEKGPFSCRQKMKNLRRLARIGDNVTLEEAGIDFYLMRGEKTSDMCYFIDQLSQMGIYDTYVIDGIYELTDKPNEDTAHVMTLQKKLADKNAVVFSMLHNNKADDNMRYALGTDQERISLTRLDVKSNKDGTFTVSCLKSNDTLPFPDVTVTFDNDGYVIDTTTHREVDIKETLKYVFKDGKSRDWKKFKADFETKSGVTKKEAYTYCQQAEKNHLVVKDLDGNFILNLDAF